MNLIHYHDPSIDPLASGRSRVNMIGIWVGLFGAPAAWVAQFSLSEPLVAYACYPYQMPLSAPIWQGLPVMLAVISIACLAVGILSGFIAWTLWRQFGRQPAGGEPVADTSVSRNRFLVKLSLMSNFIFITAIIFNIFAVLLVLPCNSWF
ncbi:MAG: hypothetical protein PHG00_01185 [Methylococcales bacterium]|nr:hypothetical protein [Methylococcales bacterium]